MRGSGNIGSIVFALAILSGVLAVCQGADPTKHRAVLILAIDQPIRPFARDLVDGIQDSTRDAIELSIFVEFRGPSPLESDEVAAQRMKLLETRYAGQPIEVLVAIGDETVSDAEKLRNDLFPSAKLLFLIARKGTVQSG